MIIGIGHKQRVGKDTVAKLIIGNLRLKGVDVQKKSFAYKLKEISSDLFSWAGMQQPGFYDTYAKDKDKILEDLGKTPREIWIEIGNHVRQTYPLVWVDYILKNNKTKVIVIPDLRYPNEFNRIKELNGITIRVDRNEAPKSKDIADNALNGEKEWDHIIDNNGSFQETSNQIREFMSLIEGRV